jgi:FHA domain
MPARNTQGDPLARYLLTASELKRLHDAGVEGKPMLVYRAAGAEFMIERLEGADRIAIGRSEEADICVRWDAEVSRLHTLLERVGGEWTIVDDGLSRNGTFLNEVRLSGRHRLADGDRIRVGGTVLAFVAGVGAGRQQTQASITAVAPAALSETQRRVLVALCRPYRDGPSLVPPASNRRIAEELCLSVDAVKLHLRALFARFGVSELAQNQKRTKLAERALTSGAVSQRDLGP